MNGRYDINSEWMFENLSVALIGVGATGTHMLDVLYSMHTCLLKLGGGGLDVYAFDGDTVEESNLGRQRYWRGDAGKNKASVCVSRYNYYGGTDWVGAGVNVDVDSVVKNINKIDFLITAIDDGKFRVDLGKKLAKISCDTLWIDAGVGGDGGQVIMGHAGQKENKLPNVYDLYGNAFDRIKKKDIEATASCGSLAASLSAQGLFTNRLAADLAGDLMFKLLRTGSINDHGAFFTTSPIEINRLAIDKDIWETFPNYGKVKKAA